MRVDLHVHTAPFSACSVLWPEEIRESALASGLEGICLTEHNVLWPPDLLEALRRDLFPIKAFPAVEVRFPFGEVLLYGFRGGIRPGDAFSDPDTFLEGARGGGAVAVLAHPLRGLSPEELLRVLDRYPLDGIEVVNGAEPPGRRPFLKSLARERGLLGTGGSDAHRPESLGKAFTRFRKAVRSEEEFLAALRAGAFAL